MSTKLVRDKIPQIIKKQGKNIVFRIAEKQEYKELLLAKLQEEVNEFVSDQNEEEIADILEVIDALIEKYQFSNVKISEIKKQKQLKKGGFDEMIVGKWARKHRNVD